MHYSLRMFLIASGMSLNLKMNSINVNFIETTAVQEMNIIDNKIQRQYSDTEVISVNLKSGDKNKIVMKKNTRLNKCVLPEQAYANPNCSEKIPGVTSDLGLNAKDYDKVVNLQDVLMMKDSDFSDI